jgi:endonuclease/exonuclease/phosphatase family metal-dependent hydrolase
MLRGRSPLTGGGVILAVALLIHAPAGARTLRVMTYNIHRCGDLGLNLDEVAAVILAANPDIVGIEEVDHMQPRTAFQAQAEELAAMTGMAYQFFGCTVDCGSILPGRYGIAILSRYDLSDRTKAFLPNSVDGTVVMEGGLEPRVLLCGTVSPPGDGGPLRFCVTHLTNGAEEESRVIRRLQAERIVSLLAGELASHGRVVLVGDLNETPSGSALGVFLTAFEDAWLDGGSGEGFTIPSDGPTVRFDYILNGTGIGPAVHAEVPATTASDHRPVVADLMPDDEPVPPEEAGEDIDGGADEEVDESFGSEADIEEGFADGGIAEDGTGEETLPEDAPGEPGEEEEAVEVMEGGCGCAVAW